MNRVLLALASLFLALGSFFVRWHLRRCERKPVLGPPDLKLITFDDWKKAQKRHPNRRRAGP